MEKYARKISNPPVEQGIAFMIPAKTATECSTVKPKQELISI